MNEKIGKDRRDCGVDWQKMKTRFTILPYNIDFREVFLQKLISKIINKMKISL